MRYFFLKSFFCRQRFCLLKKTTIFTHYIEGSKVSNLPMNYINQGPIKAAITAVGGYVPEDKLTNADLEKMVDTNDEWIVARTGIKERRILRDPAKGSSFMAIKAAEDLLEKTKVDPKEIDAIIFATITPDMNVAATAAYVASEIGATNAFGYELQAACSGFL